jgi:hypothetical protein
MARSPSPTQPTVLSELAKSSAARGPAANADGPQKRTCVDGAAKSADTRHDRRPFVGKRLMASTGELCGPGDHTPIQMRMDSAGELSYDHEQP